jgi:hypothetical protein
MVRLVTPLKLLIPLVALTLGGGLLTLSVFVLISNAIPGGFGWYWAEAVMIYDIPIWIMAVSLLLLGRKVWRKVTSSN